jgi:hypothetical protein
MPVFPNHQQCRRVTMRLKRSSSRLTPRHSSKSATTRFSNSCSPWAIGVRWALYCSERRPATNEPDSLATTTPHPPAAPRTVGRIVILAASPARFLLSRHTQPIHRRHIGGVPSDARLSSVASALLLVVSTPKTTQACAARRDRCVPCRCTVHSLWRLLSVFSQWPYRETRLTDWSNLPPAAWTDLTKSAGDSPAGITSGAMSNAIRVNT